MASHAHYKEEIKGGILCADGSQFFVVARKSVDVMFPGMVYVFLQDKGDGVWEIEDVGPTGFFKKRMAVSIRSKAGVRKSCIIADFREEKQDDIVRCFALAKQMRAMAGPLSTLGTSTEGSQFLWSPYDFK